MSDQKIKAITLERMELLFAHDGISKTGFLRECGIDVRHYNSASRGDFRLSLKMKDKIAKGLEKYRDILDEL